MKSFYRDSTKGISKTLIALLHLVVMLSNLELIPYRNLNYTVVKSRDGVVFSLYSRIFEFPKDLSTYFFLNSLSCSPVSMCQSSLDRTLVGGTTQNKNEYVLKCSQLLNTFGFNFKLVIILAIFTVANFANFYSNECFCPVGYNV